MKTKILHIITLLTFIFSASAYAQIPVLNSYSGASATIFLDFNGAEIDGTIWNENGKISAEPANLPPSTVKWIHKIISENFVLFNLNITTDASVYEKAPTRQRMRIIFTPEGNWFGPGTGASAIGSFVWGNDTPAWVFMNALSNNPYFIANAATHEIGHTLGLQHQSVYDQYGSMVTELSGGEKNIYSKETPLMGVPFYKKAIWQNGTSSLGPRIIQSDTATIAGAPNDIGYRKHIVANSNLSDAVTIERQDAGSLTLNSLGNYNYRLFDINGRILTEGSLKSGFNQIPTNPIAKGVLVLQWFDGSVTGSQKFIH
jgi:hypothetical protein